MPTRDRVEDQLRRATRNLQLMGFDPLSVKEIETYLRQTVPPPPINGVELESSVPGALPLGGGMARFEPDPAVMRLLRGQDAYTIVDDAPEPDRGLRIRTEQEIIEQKLRERLRQQRQPMGYGVA